MSVIHPDGGFIYGNVNESTLEWEGETLLTNYGGYDDITIFPLYRKMICGVSTSYEYFYMFDLDELMRNPVDDEGNRQNWTFCARIGARDQNERFMVFIEEHAEPTMTIHILDVKTGLIYSQYDISHKKFLNNFEGNYELDLSIDDSNVITVIIKKSKKLTREYNFQWDPKKKTFDGVKLKGSKENSY
jgi:hypothetical protein